MVLCAGVINALLFVLLSFKLDFMWAEQQVFESEGNHKAVNKFLARFTVDPISTFKSLDTGSILQLAEVYNLDVWHATDRVVDIYTESLPSHLQNIPYSVISVPPTPHRPQPSSVTKNDNAILMPPSQSWNLSSLDTPFHESYHPLDEVYSFFDQLVAQFPDVAKVVEMGRTAEGRRIIGITVSTGVYPGVPGGAKSGKGRQTKVKEDAEEDKQEEVHRMVKKKSKKSRRPPIRDTEKLGFVIIGAQHAREWIATSTAIYLVHSLLVNQTEANSLHKLLDHFDFHFVPVPNPDGYAYTWQTDRYWYKNRQIVGPYTRCIGLDMNRNWGYKWRPKVSSLNASSVSSPAVPTDPCSHWYPGSRAFQSPEVNSIANWVSTLPNLAAFIDLRSYGQMREHSPDSLSSQNSQIPETGAATAVSSPFSYSCNATPRDIEDQTEAALGSSQALSSAHGTSYKVGRLCETLYPAPGNVLDWMYAREAVKYGYVVHLRDTGTYGFTLPEKWIRPTGEETNRMVDYLSRFIARQTKRHF